MIGSMFISWDIHKKWRSDGVSLSMTSHIMLNISIAGILLSFFIDFVNMDGTTLHTIKICGIFQWEWCNMCSTAIHYGYNVGGNQYFNNIFGGVL